MRQGGLGACWVPPDRLDLIVFDIPQSAPGSPTLRYVKRLIGLPGETIAIHRGKLFFLPAGSRSEPAEQAPGTGERPPPDDEGEKLFRDGKFEPIRKKPEHILALRRLVYDNDHQASDLGRSTGAGSRPRRTDGRLAAQPPTCMTAQVRPASWAGCAIATSFAVK